MGSYVPDPPRLHIETPCVPSRELSRAAGCNVFLKLENLQPSGSFKSRGIGTLMWRALQQRASSSSSSSSAVRFYCSSGGNAGLACAEAARTLGRPCDVFVSAPTPDHVVARLADLGATPHRGGAGWPDADALCRAALAADADGVYVPPFDDPRIWDGNATLVDELAALERRGFFGARGVDAVVCNVGGGGLLNGVMEGVERNYRAPAPGLGLGLGPGPAVLALETAGADSLAACVRAGAHVAIPAVTSVASSLGAPRVSERTYRWAEECGATALPLPLEIPEPGKTMTTTMTRKAPRLVSAVVPDAAAVSACARFLDDARLLVEVACGATLASAYDAGTLLRPAVAPGADDAAWARVNVVLVVCGGSNISADLLAQYRARFGV
ncbi:tryptophan synthase beta subunit-like PLP-dependent enzyme [Xylaria palmicola]|nr:tryptophan synthase beta subunit-like PLP-dependent enzyme [Xylaria palmicola]